MDATVFDFHEKPFAVTPDPRCVYVTRTYRQAYTMLLSGIRERKGFLLVTGEEGTGKTTLLHQLMAQGDVLAYGLIIDSAMLPAGTFADLLKVLCTELGLTETSNERFQQLRALNAWMTTHAQENRTLAVCLDEAHHLTDDALGSLRSLSLLDTISEKPLLQILLAGPPELEEKLTLPRLRPLRQRIAVTCRLEGIEAQEVEPFVHHRLRTVGHERQDMFSPEALQGIALYSQGIPGRINSICARALFQAASMSQTAVSAEIVEEVSRALLLVPTPGNRVETSDQENSTPKQGGLAEPGGHDDRAPRPLPIGLRIAPNETSFTGNSAGKGFVRVNVRRSVLVSAALLALLAGGALYYYTRPVSIRVSAPPRLPIITRATPQQQEEGDLVVAEGQQMAFAVEASHPDVTSLHYAWFLDGQEQTREPQWTYRPQFDEGGPARKVILVRVTDQEGHTVEHSWQLRVQDVDRPPRLVAVSPEDPLIHATAGQEQRFSLEAIDPDANDQLDYVWTLDGKEVAHGQSWSFTSPAAMSKNEHAVAVIISDKAGSTLERQWTVTVEPAALQPPVITHAAPTGDVATLAEGQQLAFAIEATSAQHEPLQYFWLLNGQLQAQGPHWTYKPGFDEGGPELKTVTVRVTDRQQHLAERTWQLSVQDINRPPTITKTTPSTPTLTIPVGGEQDFSVQATDPDKNDSLLFLWSLDGREIARGQNWRLRPESALATPQPHEVQVEVADNGGFKRRLTWRVYVKQAAIPPRILTAQPAEEQVLLQAGESPIFSLQAESGSSTESTLHYEWRTNSAPWKTTPTGQFQLDALSPGLHQLTVVAVSPEGLKSAPRTWSIEVRPSGEASSPPVVATRPPLSDGASLAAVSDKEVRAWLETHRQALEERNIDRLVGLGVLESAQAERARNILSHYSSFHVAFQDVSIQISANQATVSFLRVDEIDGQRVPHPDRKVYIFRKDANGCLVAQPQ